MTPGQLEKRKKIMARAIANPPHYLSAKILAEKKKWKNTKDDGLPRY